MSNFEDAGQRSGRCHECVTLGTPLSVEQDHWLVCHEHEVKWYVGMHGTPEQWAQNQAILDQYWEIVPAQEHEEPCCPIFEDRSSLSVSKASTSG